MRLTDADVRCLERVMKRAKTRHKSEAIRRALAYLDRAEKLRSRGLAVGVYYPRSREFEELS